MPFIMLVGEKSLLDFILSDYATLTSISSGYFAHLLHLKGPFGHNTIPIVRGYHRTIKKKNKKKENEKAQNHRFSDFYLTLLFTL